MNLRSSRRKRRALERNKNHQSHLGFEKADHTLRSVSQIVGRLYQGSSLPLFILQREECGYMFLRMNDLKGGGPES